jgi:hypothetical protein
MKDADADVTQVAILVVVTLDQDYSVAETVA